MGRFLNFKNRNCHEVLVLFHVRIAIEHFVSPNEIGVCCITWETAAKHVRSDNSNVKRKVVC